MINMICRINRIYGIFLIGHIDPIQLFDNMGIIELKLQYSNDIWNYGILE